MRAVNLLPREAQDRNSLRGVNKLRVGATVLTLVVVAAVGGGFTLARSHARSEQQELAAARSALTLLQARQQETSRNAAPPLASPSVTSQEMPWMAALSTALATRIAWDRTLAELAHVVPATVTLSNVTLGPTSGTTSTPGAAGTFSISGQAYSQDGVAQLLSRLLLVPDLTQVALQSTSTDPKSNVVTFDISAQVKGASTAFTTTTTAPTSTTTTPTTTAGGAA
jgi:hypothetical protein